MKSPKQLAYATFATTLVALGVLLYYEKSTFTRKLSETESKLEKLALRTEADNNFIAGNYDEAMMLYSRLDSLTGDSLRQMRSRQIPEGDSAGISGQLRQLTAKLRQTMALLEQYRQSGPKTPKDTATIHAPPPLTDNQALAELQEKLAAAQQEIHRLKNKGVIRFTSSKNGKVTYFGDLENNMANGEGFGYWITGSTYEGTWKNNKRHGKGVFVWADGEKYEGDYQEDQRHGYGIYTSKSGRYEGYWAHDMRHGEGRLYEPNGKLKVHGIWEKDKLIKTIK
jgi:hypothetical protein